MNPISVGGCPGAVNYSGGDVWFSVVVPPTGYIGINTTEGGVCAGGMAFYTAPNCATGPYQYIGAGAGICSIDGLNGPNTPTGFVFNPANYGLTPGQTVYIRYWERNNNENGNFTICAYNPAVPVGDDPCNAVLLTAADPCVPVEYNTENVQPTPSSITLGPAAPPTPSCGNPLAPSPGTNLRDMWFRVVVPPTGAMTVTTVAGTLTDMAMAWYRLTSGVACGTGTLTQIPGVGCADNQSAANRMPRINSSTAGIALTPGETIYVRVWNRPVAEYTYYGSFSICVTPNNPPPNDNPCGAIALEASGDCVMSPATNENATNTLTPFAPGASTVAVPSCGAPANGDVWFTVDVPGDLIAPYGLNFAADDMGATPALDFAMAIYRDVSPLGCGSQLDLVQVPGACAIAGTGPNPLMPTLLVPVTALTPGERLYIRVWRQTVNQGPFSICVRRTDPLSCQGTVYDTGGPTGQYQNNENIVQQYCPAKVGDVVTLTFSQFNVEAGWDFMRIYNGDDIGDPLIGTWTGGLSPGTVTATLAGNPTGCLTIRFTSDGIITGAGYTFKVTCGPPGPPPPTPIGDCGLTIYDPGGATGNYPNNLGVQAVSVAPYTSPTYCPNTPGDVLTMTFNTFDVETFFDAMYIYNDDVVNHSALINSGNGPQGTWSGPYNPPPPPNGGFWGNGLPGPIVSSITAGNPNGCLTLQLYTDGIVVGTGWSATITCGPPPPPDPPPVGQCGLVFFDPGGANAPYSDNQTSTQTYCAPAGQIMSVNFTQFDLENNWDKLYVFDGPNTASTMISSGNGVGFGPAPFGPGAYWGTSLPGPFTSSTPGGCLTFYFVSDASVVRAGWRARTSCTPQAPNDNPCTPVGATLLTVAPTCNLTSSSNLGATITSGAPPPGCGNFNGKDVWFRFVAPPSGRVYIDSKAGTLTDGAMALYAATTCAGPFTLIECDDDDGENLMPAIDRMCNPLTPGATYWIRFYGYGGAQGTFELCVVGGNGNTSLQSDCTGSFTLCSNTTFTNSSYGSGCNSDLASGNWGCLSGGERQGAWFAFRTQGAGTLGMQITPASPGDIDWAVWGPFPTTGVPNPVATSCVLSSAPVRCSFASQFNTTTAGGANPTAATGMGRLTFGGAGNFANPTPVTLGVHSESADGWVPGINVAANQVYLLFVDDHHLGGESYTVSWNATPTTVMDCFLLPVVDLDLQAKPAMSTVDLVWSTTSETNSSHFIVERSGNGVDFTPIGAVEAMGTTFAPTEYLLVDEAPLMGINYYRLQQVDLDGGAAPSNVVTALFKGDAVRVMVVPNPARNDADVVLSSAYEGKLSVRIVDGSGRTVTTLQTSEGVQRFAIPVEKMEAGSYTVHLYTENGATYGRTRFVKQ